MCLYPKLIKNPKYKPNKKNGGNVPVCDDDRKLYVPVGCGVCIECCKKKAREWQVRLNEELKENKNAHFITLTFSEEELSKLCTEMQIEESNAVATKAVRRWLERYRKKNKKSFKHWLITELGHVGTERIHLHGIVWGDIEEIKKYWNYGNVGVGQYCNERTISYIIKYVTKIDNDHKGYKPIILSSAGIGRCYIEKAYSLKNSYKKNNTNENYRLPNGQKIALPIYYRNYIYSEVERENLWIEKLDKMERWVLGQKIDISQGLELFEEIQINAQKLNEKLGYGNNSKEWQKKAYNVTNRKLNKLNKTKKYLESKKEKFNKL